MFSKHLNEYSFYPFADRLASKVARRDSLAQKLACRPNKQDLIDRNIIHMQSENDRKEFREAIGAKLTR